MLTNLNNAFYILKINLIAALLLLAAPILSAQQADFPTLDSLPAQLDSLPEYQVKDFAQKLANQAAEIQYLLHQKAEQASLDRENISEQLATVKADTLATKEERQLLEKALKATKRTEKSALQASKKVEKIAAFTLEVANMDSAELRKNLPKAYKKVAALIPPPPVDDTPIAEVIGSVSIADPATEPGPETDLTTAEIPAPEAEQPDPPQKEQAKKPSRPSVKTYDPKADVMLHPPPMPCLLTVDTRDAFSGEQHRELQKEELFRYTNPSLKSYYQDREHVICQAAASTKGGVYLLQLQFTINDVNAQRAFGSLPRNGVAIIKLLDGETFTLYNLRADEGKLSEDKRSYQYNGQYVIEGGMLKKMQKTLLDKVRIAWSTGYEDYDIQNVDLLERQLPCLLKK